MTKTHLITDPVAIAVAHMIGGLRAKFEEAEKELKDRFEKEANELAASFNLQKETLWADLTEKASLPPCDKEAGFGYQIDLDYAEEHGLIFLIEMNEEKDDCDCIICQTRRGGASMGSILEKLMNDPAVG
jgi:hypothetical protein